MKKSVVILMAVFLISLNSVTLIASNPSENTNSKEVKQEEASNQLLIVWTSSDPEVAHKMVFMYAYNAQKMGGGIRLHFLYGDLRPN